MVLTVARVRLHDLRSSVPDPDILISSFTNMYNTVNNVINNEFHVNNECIVGSAGVNDMVASNFGVGKNDIFIS